MKSSKQMPPFSSLFVIPLLVFSLGLLPANLRAAASGRQETFASPEDAIAALRGAATADDRAALHQLFGPQFDQLLTGDAVQDANNIKKFAARMNQRCHPVKDGEDKITLEIGQDDWPMPIPLTKAGGKWYFDTVAGKEEIIDRHIGEDELHAIGTCRAYVTAQRRYASENPEGNTGTSYALHFKSLPGKKDGLYWPVVGNEPESPFGSLVATAEEQGYVVHKRGTGPHPFHGYYFKILTRQGEAAPGGKQDYMSGGRLTGGFALVAYPESWNESGIMTFIVNQDGKVFQQNLGEDTSKMAPGIKEYNPDSDWKLVKDEGILRAESEK